MDAIAPLLGLILTSMIFISPGILALLLAFFIGEFLYIGAANLLPETHKHKSWLIALSMLIGAILIFLITSFIRH